MTEQKRMSRTARIIITTIASILILALVAVVFVGYRLYSGMNNAFEIALSDSQVLAENAKAVELDFDFKRGSVLYDVEFYSQGKKYEYKINSDGEILFGSRQSEQGSTAQQSQDSSSLNATLSDITEQHAKQLALSQAGIDESKIYDYDSDIENLNGVKVYDIEFKYDGYEYNYYINAANGAVVQFNKEIDN